MEKLYCITSPMLRGCKMGCWEGTVKDLVARYRTPYGIVHATVFACTQRRTLEKQLHLYCNQFSIVGELYDMQAIPLFMQFCEQHCHDANNIENTSYAERASRLLKKRKLEAKVEQEQELKRRRHRFLTSLDRLIEDTCEVGPGRQINAVEFKSKLCAALGRKVMHKELEPALLKRGYIYTVAKPDGHSERVYKGLQWKH